MDFETLKWHASMGYELVGRLTRKEGRCPCGRWSCEACKWIGGISYYDYELSILASHPK